MPTNEIKLTDEFTSTMQQLVAEAAKAVPSGFSDDIGSHPNGSDGKQDEFASLNERILGLEQIMTKGFAQLSKTEAESETSSHLRRMDEHLVALRSTESVNQRLFNSLHQELKSYRDDFLRESLQKPFIRDLVILFDDLSSLAAQMEPASGGSDAKGPVAQWSANLQNAIHTLVEILHRMEVNEIEVKEMVDRSLHRVVSYEPADFAEDDGRIVMRVKRGFVWRDQVLRPEEVVAKRFS